MVMKKFSLPKIFVLLTGLFSSVMFWAPLALHADGQVQFVGRNSSVKPSDYEDISLSPGNIQAIEEENTQVKAFLKTGKATPTDIEIVASRGIHPVTPGNRYYTFPTDFPDFIPVSHESMIPPPAPIDISDTLGLLSELDRNYFKGYTDLSHSSNIDGRGGKVLGEAYFEGTVDSLGYHLDNSLKDVESLPQKTSILTLSVQSKSGDEETQAHDILSRLKQSLPVDLPLSLPLAASLALIGGLAISALAARGIRANYRITDSDTTLATTVRGVRIHELMHVQDFKNAAEGKGNIPKAMLSKESPYHRFAEALMEVRAGCAEIASGEPVNVDYLRQNLADLLQQMSAFSGILAQTNPSLINSARDDIRYAMTYLQQYQNQFLNF